MIKNTTIMEVKRGRCPHCGKVFGFKRYPVVFAAESLEVAKKFTNEVGFIVECPHCKGEMAYQYPLYFVDVPNKMWMIYASDEEKVDEMLDNLSSYEGDFSKFKYVGEVRLGTFTSWDEFARHVQGLIKKTERHQKRAKNAGNLKVQTNTRLCQS